MQHRVAISGQPGTKSRTLRGRNWRGARIVDDVESLAAHGPQTETGRVASGLCWVTPGGGGFGTGASVAAPVFACAAQFDPFEECRLVVRPKERLSPQSDVQFAHLAGKVVIGEAEADEFGRVSRQREVPALDRNRDVRQFAHIPNGVRCTVPAVRTEPFPRPFPIDQHSVVRLFAEFVPVRFVNADLNGVAPPLVVWFRKYQERGPDVVHETSHRHTQLPVGCRDRLRGHPETDVARNQQLTVLDLPAAVAAFLKVPLVQAGIGVEIVPEQHIVVVADGHRGPLSGRQPARVGRRDGDGRDTGQHAGDHNDLALRRGHGNRRIGRSRGVVERVAIGIGKVAGDIKPDRGAHPNRVVGDRAHRLGRPVGHQHLEALGGRESVRIARCDGDGGATRVPGHYRKRIARHRWRNDIRVGRRGRVGEVLAIGFVEVLGNRQPSPVAVEQRRIWHLAARLGWPVGYRHLEVLRGREPVRVARRDGDGDRAAGHAGD